MTVTVTEKVYLWLRENGVPDDINVIHAAFPDVKKNTLSQIKKRFVHGQQPRKIATPKPVTEPVIFSHHDTIINEEFVEATLVNCAMNNPTDPKVAALLIQWLDKKKAIAPANNQEISEQNTYHREYKEIQDEVFTASDNESFD
jgi:hypothetical protein